MVALVIPDVTNPVYFDITRGAEDAAAEAGYTLLLADFRESGRLEREAIDRAVPAVEGLVLGGPRISDSAIRMAAKQRPTVILNRAVAGLPSVVIDNPRGIRRAAEHLGELGHDTITYLAGPEASWADGMRWRALREAGLELDLRVRRLGPYPPTFAGGLAAVDDLLRQPTTAVVAYNDLMAIGLMRGLQRAGVPVPREVSVVGFDNIFGSDFCTPALTTVAAPLRALGAAGVRRLLAQLGGATALDGAARRAAGPAGRAGLDGSAQPEEVLPGPGDHQRVRVGRPGVGVDRGRVQVVQVHRPHPFLGDAGGQGDRDPQALAAAPRRRCPRRAGGSNGPGPPRGRPGSGPTASRSSRGSGSRSPRSPGAWR